MPIKHHTETAFMLLLALVIAATAMFASLLPALPGGMLYWIVLMTATCVYPLILKPFFRKNRADYEFRLLHWVPAFILVLWFVLETFKHLWFVGVLRTGFFIAWGLPLTILGTGLLILFACHALRRWQTRIPLLAGLLVTASILGISSEALAWNKNLSAQIFPEREASRMVAADFTAFMSRFMSGSTTTTIIATSGSSSSAASQQSSRHSDSGPVAVADPTTPPVPVRTTRLPKSGPEDIAALLFVTLLGAYSFVLHTRARARVVEWA